VFEEGYLAFVIIIFNYRYQVTILFCPYFIAISIRLIFAKKSVCWALAWFIRRIYYCNLQFLPYG